MLNVNVRGVAYDELGRPLILLADNSEEKMLPIWVGMLEAHSIVMAIESYSMSRPLTHDLIVNLCASLEVSVAKVVISDLKDNTFYAEIHLLKGEKTYLLDARPSDAIAVALRTKSPIYLTDTVAAQMINIQELIDGNMDDTLDEVASNIIKDYKKSLH